MREPDGVFPLRSMIGGRPQTIDLPFYILPDGREFITDQDIVERSAGEFVARFSNYWTRDEQRCGFVGPVNG